MEKITIEKAMENIYSNKYLIPSFQREYVWDKKKIAELFSSIMSDYPISTMLFWEINSEDGKNLCEFYQFLKKFKKGDKNNNLEPDVASKSEFIAIIDGQQRLTSLYLALRGQYYFGNKGKEYHLYLKLAKDDEKGYIFDWKYDIDKRFFIDTKTNEKWFKCADVLDRSLRDSDNNLNEKIQTENELSIGEFRILDNFYNKIVKEVNILNFFLEKSQNSNRAVEIFTRINSGGKKLDFSDIAFSVVLANWGSENFRKDIENLNSEIKDFELEKNFIFKSILFVLEKKIRFDLGTFGKEFIQGELKNSWDKLKKCYKDVFAALSEQMGIDQKRLGAMNLALPILYFVYHNNIQLSTQSEAKNRKIISNWLFRAMVSNAITSSSDDKLENIRKAMQKAKKDKDLNTKEFPANYIEKECNYMRINPKDVEKLLKSSYNSRESWIVLYMLYTYSDITTASYNQDHIHPKSAFKKSNNDDRWNSVVNIELLKEKPNKSKGNRPFDEWLNNSDYVKHEGGKDEFLRTNYIPNNINLSQDNFDEFYNERFKILHDKLCEILNAKSSYDNNDVEDDDEQ